MQILLWLELHADLEPRLMQDRQPLRHPASAMLDVSGLCATEYRQKQQIASWGIALSSTSYYDKNRDALFEQYHAYDPEVVHRAWAPEHLKGRKPGFACDIGAGTGRDANWLAEQGWEVLAVEPSKFRELGEENSNPRVTWLDDTLPDLQKLRRPGPAIRPHPAALGLDACSEVQTGTGIPHPHRIAESLRPARNQPAAWQRRGGKPLAAASTLSAPMN